MSATLAADLYVSYFNSPSPPIHVSVRRFRIKEHFVEDIASTLRFPPKDALAASKIAIDCNRLFCKSAPPKNDMENLFKLAVRITLVVRRPGGSVLIFVPGMNEIMSIIDLIEKMYTPGTRYTCVPIHSDIPFEEQMTAFDAPALDEVKVIIATNAAESSITLPNVDHVICLGVCKQIVYNPTNHRQMLTATWISQSSAKQRAGRTGRVREGNVYHLYTRRCYEEAMSKFEVGEMLRIPLDSVILTLKDTMNEKAIPILLQCLEPPDLSTIERSFNSLYKSSFISRADDNGEITTLGSFVSSLGIDLTLGYLIGLGVQFGVGPETIEIAAVMSFPHDPWNSSNPLFHEPPVFNGTSFHGCLPSSLLLPSHHDLNSYYIWHIQESLPLRLKFIFGASCSNKSDVRL